MMPIKQRKWGLSLKYGAHNFNAINYLKSEVLVRKTSNGLYKNL